MTAQENPVGCSSIRAPEVSTFDTAELPSNLSYERENLNIKLPPQLKRSNNSRQKISMKTFIIEELKKIPVNIDSFLKIVDESSLKVD